MFWAKNEKKVLLNMQRLIFLGTGTSQGVPVIGCRCPVCTSKDARDKRLRTSAVIECDSRVFVIDAGPDFRQQMLRYGAKAITALLLTHKHKDHIAGIDDVRALNFVDYPVIRPVDIYASEDTLDCVKKDFDYAFETVKYRGVPEIRLHQIDRNSAFEVDGIKVIPIRGSHSRFEITGYRIGEIAYMTDFKTIEDSELEKIRGVKVLVINALRWKSHDSHFCVDEALDIISKVRPHEAFLTHMSHEIGLHAESELKLPDGVHLAYDELRVEI